MGVEYCANSHKMPQKPTSLLLATRNPGKITELRALLEPLRAVLLQPDQLGLQLTPPEEGESYAENARQKAVAYARLSGLWALADDSGLEVDALGGAPGLHSARFAGEGRSDYDRRQRLLKHLHDHPQPWTARFRCVVALASPEGQLDFAEGACEGLVIVEERGTQGFGYDPIFLVAGTGKTMAELELVEKNQLSHRARAVHALLPKLQQRLRGG
jgi:XTP/dITP diphosphohydrolase